MRKQKKLNDKIVSLQKRLSVYNSRCEIKNKRFQNNKHQVKKHNKLYKTFLNEVMDLWGQQIEDICNKSISQRMEKKNTICN